MGIRMRFKPAERAAFVPGAEIEWLDVTRWRSGVVAGEIEQPKRGDNGYEYLPVRDTGPTTRTIRTGRTYSVCAGHVRLPIRPTVE